MIAYHVNEIGNSPSTMMSRDLGNDKFFSPGKKSHTLLKNTYSGYCKLFYIFSSVTLNGSTIFSFIEDVAKILLLP